MIYEQLKEYNFFHHLYFPGQRTKRSTYLACLCFCFYFSSLFFSPLLFVSLYDAPRKQFFTEFVYTVVLTCERRGSYVEIHAFSLYNSYIVNMSYAFKLL